MRLPEAPARLDSVQPTEASSAKAILQKRPQMVTSQHGSILFVPLPLQAETNGRITCTPPAQTGSVARISNTPKPMPKAPRLCALEGLHDGDGIQNHDRCRGRSDHGPKPLQPRICPEFLKITKSTRSMKLRDVAASVVAASASKDPKVLTHATVTAVGGEGTGSCGRSRYDPPPGRSARVGGEPL